MEFSQTGLLPKFLNHMKEKNNREVKVNLVDRYKFLTKYQHISKRRKNQVQIKERKENLTFYMKIILENMGLNLKAQTTEYRQNGDYIYSIIKQLLRSK